MCEWSAGRASPQCPFMLVRPSQPAHSARSTSTLHRVSEKAGCEMTYRAVYRREPDGRWIVEMPQVKGCHSYGRTIDQARHRIREALALFVENAASAEIEDDVRMPASVKGAVRNAQRMRQRLEAARTQVSAAEERAVRQLRKTMKLGHRDAGSILGLSHQRVHQLEKKKAG